MTQISKNAYFKITDKHGDDYLCPLVAVKKGVELSESDYGEFVEKDVVERYSGNTEIDSNWEENSMSDNETKTLCALQDEGYFQSNLGDFMKMIAPAHFFCKNCGRQRGKFREFM